MEKITVSYRHNWDCEGHYTTQNIKISKELLNEFNKYLTEQRNYLQGKSVITHEEMGILTYAKEVKNLERCLTLTQLKFLWIFLMEKKIDNSRVIPNRNTMLIVV